MNMKTLTYAMAAMAALALCACSEVDAKAKKPDREKQIAVQSYTCHQMNLTDMFKMFKELGVKNVEICGGKLGGDYPNVGAGPNMKPEHLQYLKDIAKKNDITLISYGVCAPKDEKGIKAVCEFAKELGLKFVSTECDPKTFPIWEKYCGEYGIKMCIHNHARRDKNPNYKFWDYNWVAKEIAPYKNIGVCADNGAWECSGLNSVEGAKVLGDKIFIVHLKDQKKFNVRNSPAVVYGTGEVDVAAFLKQLDKQGFDGYLIIEHGNDPIEAKRDIISKDMDFIRKN